MLGRISPYLLGGTIQLDRDAAEAAIRTKIAEPMGLSVNEAASVILRIAVHNMALGVRLVSVQRGRDPRDYVLVPFGGAGGLHAALVAEELGIRLAGKRYRESDLEEGGEDIVTVEVDEWTVGLSICYDVRFPELYRILALRGAQVMVVPAAFTAVTGRAHWELLLRARAVENQAFVVAAGDWGEHPDGTRTWGHSMVVDPWGDVLAGMADGDGVVVAELDPRRLEEIRAALPALANRRPGAYRWPSPVEA